VNRTHRRFAGRVAVVAACAFELAAVTGCAESGGASSPHASMSFAEAMKASGSAVSRAVPELSHLMDSPPSDVVAGTVLDVRPDRGWINLPESENAGGIDVRVVPFDSADPHFRTVLVSVDVESVLRDDGGLVRPETEAAMVADRTVDVTIVLPGDTTFEAARSELVALGDVIIPIAEQDRGAFGWVVVPFSGYDMVIDVHADGSVYMPFADDSIAHAVLGDLASADEVAAAVRIS
jgi:hypothetical protein